MQRYLWLIVLGCACYFNVHAQNLPVFVSPLSADKSVICVGNKVVLKAQVVFAKQYQFQQKNVNSLQFENIAGASGTLDTIQNNIQFEIQSVLSNNTFRILITNDTLLTVSNEIVIAPQQPVISFQPIDLQQCNGLNVDFRVAATGVSTLSYQWQFSSDGGSVFSNITASSKYISPNSPSVQVKSILMQTIIPTIVVKSRMPQVVRYAQILFIYL